VKTSAGIWRVSVFLSIFRTPVDAVSCCCPSEATKTKGSWYAPTAAVFLCSASDTIYFFAGRMPVAIWRRSLLSQKKDGELCH